MGLVLLNLFCISLAAQGDTTPEEATCRAGEPCKGGFTSPYYWPHAHGHPSYYGNPPWPGPTDLPASFKWRWNGPTGTLYEESFNGAVIDDKKNIYITGDRHVYKMSEDGVLVWTYSMPGQTSGDGPAIYEGKLNGATTDGLIFSIDMETGFQKWVTKASDHDGAEYSQLAVHSGVVVTQGDKRCQSVPFEACAAAKVRGLNSTDGAVLWTFDPDEVLWDWFPQFPDDDSVIFMDKTGGLFRLRLQTGELIWKAAGTPYTWTDGSQFMASNGLTYTVQVSTTACRSQPRHVTDCEGYVTAYKTSDGSQVWRITVPKPPNTSPVVGRLGDGDKLSLVMGIGQQSMLGCSPPALFVYGFPLPDLIKQISFLAIHTVSVWLGDRNWMLWGSHTRTHDVYTFDAETGKPLWAWSGPTSHRMCNRGDEDGFVSRYMSGLRPVSCPTPWGQPRIGTDGTIYIANENGDFFAIRDANQDNHIDDDKEVSVFHTGATFPHCGSAHAPGMIVAVNFDGVFVWKS
mmetsp:Transcript_86492/g.209746  ORF Transcript_86492/g.209746 Transcript_86492/m.209746 type:complete len:515 (-) Transcript_86492:424-1968(-)